MRRGTTDEQIERHRFLAQNVVAQVTNPPIDSAREKSVMALGALVTGFLATPEVNANLHTNLKGIVGRTLWLEQLRAIGVTLAHSIVGTALIGFAVKAALGLLPHREHEQKGRDLADRGEEGYVG